MRLKTKKLKLHHITFSLAIIGFLIIITGNFFDISVTKKLCYLIGGLFLLSSVVLEKNVFYSVFECILIVGATIAFFHISPFWKGSIPIGLGIIASLYFGIKGQSKDYLTWFSMAGILTATLGYALTNTVIYFIAGLFLATYSFCAFKRGEVIALAFGILNVVFALTAFLEILKII